MNPKNLLTALILAAAVSAQADTAGPSARFTDFFVQAFGQETLSQFAACAQDPDRFVFSQDASFGGGARIVTIGCLDDRGEPNSTMVSIQELNARTGSAYAVYMTDTDGDFTLFNGPTRNAQSNLGRIDANTARQAVRAAAGRSEDHRRALQNAEDMMGQFPCP